MERALNSMDDDTAEPGDLFDEWDGEPNDPSDFSERDEADQMALSLSMRSGTTDGAPWVEVFAHESREISAETIASDKIVPIARVDQGGLRMFPIVSASYRPEHLQPKYGELTSILIPWIDTRPLPQTIPDFDDLLARLPVGFGRHAKYGLGLKWAYRLIPETIAAIGGVRELVLDASDKPRLDGDRFHMGQTLFEDLRRALDSIVNRSRARSLEDRKTLAFNELLHAADPARFAQRIRAPKPHEIYELVKVGAGQRRSADVQRAAMDVVGQDAQAIAKSNPTELMSLMAKIEEVALGELIARMAAMLESDLTEAKWQAFFKANPFVLSLAFAYPMTLIQDQAHVGGSTIRGDGESIADFLFGLRATGSLALIEIKRPSTALVESKPFRGDIYAAHRDCVSAVAQVLDQRAQLIENFAAKSRSAQLRDKHVATVHCVVIAGMAPAEPERGRSFDLFRNATKDVAIVTFDELLDKLRHIHALMSRPDQAEANSTTDSPREADEESDLV